MNSTARPIDRPDFVLRSWADVEIQPGTNFDRDHRLEFRVRDSRDVDVTPGGDVHFRVALGEYEESRLTWTLPAELGQQYELRGIQLGLDEDDAMRNPVVSDTGGELYPGTFFQVSNVHHNGRLVTLTLVRARTDAPLVLPFFYSYVLAVADSAGVVHKVDPRIYNEGDGGTWPRQR